MSSPVIHDLQQNETRGRKRVFWSWVCSDPSLLRDSIHDVHGYLELLHRSEIFSSFETYCNCRVSSCSFAPSFMPVRSCSPRIGSAYPLQVGNYWDRCLESSCYVARGYRSLNGLKYTLHLAFGIVCWGCRCRCHLPVNATADRRNYSLLCWGHVK